MDLREEVYATHPTPRRQGKAMPALVETTRQTSEVMVRFLEHALKEEKYQ